MKKRSGFNVMMRLIGLVKPLAVYMIIAIIMGLIGNLCATFITIFGGYAILSATGGNSPLPLVALFICVVAFAVVRGGLRYAEQACNHFIAFKLLALIRDKVFKALRTLCPAKLEGRDKGDLISVITSDIELLEVFYAHTISPAAIWLLFTVIMSVFIGSYNLVSGLIALAAYIIVGIIVPVVISKLSGDSGIKFRTKSGELSSFVLESLRGLSETIQYGAGKNRLEKMNKMTDDLSGEEAEMKRMTGRNMAVTNSIILIFDLAMLFCGVALYNNGALGFDGVLITTIALFSSFGPSVALANLGSTLQNTFAAGNRVLDILDEKPSVAEITGCDDAAFGDVSVSDVSFSYGGETILQNVSITVPENKVIGIVGKSGSGKSTLLKLLMRFWNVNNGDISVKGRSINNINTSQLRDMESYVTQETHLFHDSIKSSLKIAKLDATDEEIITACKKASVHDFIMTLPQGYDTPVGELGDTLSGGERQRIGVARAFLHNAPLMLLDEPTSNLDSLNEAVILRSLGEQSRGKTVVLVSHRQSTMRIADTVYSVEHGRMSRHEKKYKR